jgi:adenylate cyclase
MSTPLKTYWPPISLLRLRALLAGAGGEEAAYRDYRDRYREMAKSLGLAGHIK